MFSALLLVLAGADSSDTWEEHAQKTRALDAWEKGESPGPARPAGSVAETVDMIVPDCVTKSCAQTLTACNKDTDNCGSRLRCAFQAAGKDGDIGQCWAKMTWETMGNPEVSIFDCAKQRACMRTGFQSSFLEAQVQKRGLAGEAEAAEAAREAKEMAQEMPALSNAEHMEQMLPLVAHMAKHRVYMSAVSSLLQQSQAELAKAEQGDTSEAQKAKIFKLLGALEAAMGGLHGHVESLEADKGNLEHEHEELEASARGAPLPELAELVAHVASSGASQLRTAVPATH